jgi:hypothetical protein
MDVHPPKYGIVAFMFDPYPDQFLVTQQSGAPVGRHPPDPHDAWMAHLISGKSGD